MDSIKVVSQWKQIKVLGKGGFGLVTLWRNETIAHCIAVKWLRENELHNIIQEKHKERWCKEVEMMYKLSHPNIVLAVPVPVELETAMKSSLPLLAMEYCELGDLRQPKNCCGLKETVVRDILMDVSDGLSYLHSCKVIHRDLKPDNIVRKEINGKIFNKLIDLGYAKDLNQGSLCESFVGTIQYLAPELFLGKTYTSSVDYWSLGIVAYELITGHRPFLPESSPANWMKQIKDKKRNIITVFQSWSGDIVHSSSLSKVNHLSSCIRADLEKWFQLALDWDGTNRGKDLETKKVEIFSSLKELLGKKCIQIFCFPTCELLSYTISKDISVSQVQYWLAKDLDVEVDDQILLLPDGKYINPRANFNNLSNEKTIFLFSSGAMKIRSRPILKPLFVRELLEDPKKQLNYQILKRSSSDAVFFLQSEVNLYRNVLDAVKAKVENVKSRMLAAETLFEDATDEWHQTKACANFFMHSHKTDLENYVEMRKTGVLEKGELANKWIQRVNEVESQMKKIQNTYDSNINEQKEVLKLFKESYLVFENHSLLDVLRSPLDDILDEGLTLHERISKIPKDVRGHAMCNTDMVRVLYKAMETSAKLLRHADLTNLFQLIFEAEENIAKIVPPWTIWLKSTKMMRQIIESAQKERQKDVWGLFKKCDASDAQPKMKSLKEPADNSLDKKQFSPFHIPKTVTANLASPIDEPVLLPNFAISGSVSVPFVSGNLSLTPSLSYDLIRDNYQLRARTQDLTQTYQSLVKDMNSLNWDFLAN